MTSVRFLTWPLIYTRLESQFFLRLLFKDIRTEFCFLAFLLTDISSIIFLGSFILGIICLIIYLIIVALLVKLFCLAFLDDLI